MDDLGNGSASAEDTQQPETAPGAGMRRIVGLLVAATVLYVAKSVLIPLAIATMLTVILSPVAGRLERFVGRTLSAALLVLLSVALLGGLAYFFTSELTGVAREVASYSENITHKIAALKSTLPSSLASIKHLIDTIDAQIGGVRGSSNVPVVQIMPPPKSIADQLSPTIPVIGGLFQAFMVIVLMFFLLYDRHGLRDRMVRLAARARIPVAAKALDEAGERVSRYLLFYSLINLSFGICVGILCWAVGLERPVLWGTLSFLLRYVPYIGAITSAALPTLVAVAVFPGWWRALAILGIYTGIDQVMAEFVEPVVIGKGVGVSAVALLTSAIFWAWLWGPVGLVLSTPFSVCLKVAGDYIPSLGFFSILLGEGSGLDGFHDYYRWLLEMDLDSARDSVVHYCGLHGLQETFTDLLVPAIELADRERAHNNIPASSYRLILDTTRDLAGELGARFAKPQAVPRMRLLGLWPPEESMPVALTMIIQLLRLDSFAVGVPPADSQFDAIRRLTAGYGPDLAIVAWHAAEHLPAVVGLVQPLMAETPRPAVFGLGPCSPEEREQLLQLGCLRVCTDIIEARRAVWRFAARRERDRRVGSAGTVAGAARG
jgi:predicted PurR-regulated permease PerM